MPESDQFDNPVGLNPEIAYTPEYTDADTDHGEYIPECNGRQQ